MHAFKCYKGNMQQDKCRKENKCKTSVGNYMQNIMNEWMDLLEGGLGPKCMDYSLDFNHSLSEIYRSCKNLDFS
jgi:hypothetical protein